MEISSFKDVEKYLRNKQVYFRKEISDSDFKTVAKGSFVSSVGGVEVERLNERVISFDINVNGLFTTIYEYKTDKEFFKWIKDNFIPVNELILNWNKNN